MNDVENVYNEIVLLINQLKVKDFNDISKASVSVDNKIVDKLEAIFSKIGNDFTLSKKVCYKLLKNPDESIKLQGAMRLLKLKEYSILAYFTILKIKFFSRSSYNSFHADLFLDSLKNEKN